MKKLIRYIKKPSNIIIYLSNKSFFKWISDKVYLKIKFKLIMGKSLNFEKVQTFNEKLQWLKLNDRKEIYTTMVDKYETKKYVSDIIGEKYIVPLLEVYDKFEEIDFEKLPNKFVLKPTHTSGNVFICKDKSKVDYKKLKKQVNKWLKRKYYYCHREWPYKNVKPRIIAEKYIEDAGGQDLMDYKLFCFNGNAKIILVCSNRKGSFKNTNFYDTNWNLLPFTRANHENNFMGIKRPEQLEEMLEIAEKLSKEIPFVRVDLYETNGNVYFGEMTFFPSAGFEGFKPKEYDKILGDMLQLSKE